MKFTILLFLTLWMLSFAKSQSYYQRNDPDPYDRQQQANTRDVSNYEAQGRAASYNSKFAGSRNEEEARLNFYRRRYRRRRPSYYSDPCYQRRRSYGRSTQSTRNQGRFLWDINVHNYYPASPVRPSLGLLSDYDCEYDYYNQPAFGGLGNFLALFSPGGLLNPGANRPQRPQAPIGGDVDPGVDPQNPDDIFDPVYEDPPTRPQFDESPRPPSVPQLVGGTASLVNNLIQTLSGNRPISRRRSYSGNRNTSSNRNTRISGNRNNSGNRRYSG